MLRPPGLEIETGARLVGKWAEAGQGLGAQVHARSGRGDGARGATGGSVSVSLLRG